MTIQELNKINHICKLERSQLLHLLATFAQNQKTFSLLVTFLLENRSDFLDVECLLLG